MLSAWHTHAMAAGNPQQLESAARGVKAAAATQRDAQLGRLDAALAKLAKAVDGKLLSSFCRGIGM